MASVGERLPLQDTSAHNAMPDAAKATATEKESIEDRYKKMTQLQHILARPDTYVGSIEKHTLPLWVYEGGEMVHRPVSFVPGLYKIFDEILVNAADNKQRDPSMDSLKVVIDPEKNLVSVYNNGDGVPVEMHKEEGVYVPELIFGHLLTSSNFDDNVKKTTGGRNGYGAKLTNIFSTEFIIETADGKREKKYKQVFSNNMGDKSKPAITKCKPVDNWTKVTFKPDLTKFNMTYLEEDVVALMKKRVVDLAGTLGKTVKVELNGQRVPIKSFTDYVNLYLQAASKLKPEPLPRVVEKVNDRWEVCVSLSDGQFQQVSFVNGINTTKGGTHVEHVTAQIANHVMSIVNKKNKSANLKAHAARNHLWVFVNALIDNPAFDSQTKETLTTRQSSFGSKCELSQEFLKKVAKSGVVENLLTWADFKQSKDLKKTDGAKRQRITGITKLEDANDAGGKNSDKCTLILTEGDSAKALAMAGISVVGRNHYGVFPLRGKLLNVREANLKQIMDNAEIQNIKQILGLQQNKVYDSVKSLRYGHLMIMTDQDHDGSHIKGLLINFIHSFWPSLLKIPSFMVEFITPIVKATNHKSGKVLSFYTMPEYESWKESLGGNATGWTVKYYKGLGTSTSKEGKEYFRDIEKHKKDFVWADDKDGESIEMAFSKKKIEERKNWLRQYEPGTYLDQKAKLIKYSEFINKELILFSMADLQRSIPSMVDGLKPGQRKILFCSFKRNFVKEAKVAQFSGYVSEHSAYHHGEQSLAGTIIGMAQDFVGSNNINLLQPNGQFGTRHQGGKDHASARYIYTKLSPLTRVLFPKDDDGLLNYQNEDGQSIEPYWYMPILPMVLVNGSEGIGTGWSSYIPNYNPRDIVDNLRRLLNDEPMQPMAPWYRGFKGLIEQTAAKENGVTFTISGIVDEIEGPMLKITELPVRRWTQDYKEYLEFLMTGSEKVKEPFIKDYREHNDDTSVHFEVYLSEENLNAAKSEGLLKKFKLTTTVATSNMHLFDANGAIKKYDTPEQILEEFFHLRLEYYEKRKKVLLNNLELELLKLDNKVRFILGVVNGEIIVNNRKRAELFLELHQKGFTPFPKKTKGVEAVIAGSTEEVEENDDSPVVVGKGIKASDYEYLLSMAIGTLTLEKVQELCAEKDKLDGEVQELRGATPRSLWLKDLDSFEKHYAELEKEDAEAEVARKQIRAKSAGMGGISKAVAPKNPRKKASEGEGKQPKAKGPAKKKAVSVDSDEEDDEITALKDRLAKYNLNSSSPEASTETMDVDAAPKRVTTKRAAAKKTAQVLLEISDEEEGDDQGGEDDEESEADDEDFSVIQSEPPKAAAKKGGGAGRGKKQAAADNDDEDFSAIEDEPPKAAAKKGGGAGRGKKQAATNAKAAPAAKATASGTGGRKKRGPAAGQKLITDVLKPAADEAAVVAAAITSPDKKVRKMRPSPFNKKSGKVSAAVVAAVSSSYSSNSFASDETGGSSPSEVTQQQNQEDEAPVARPAARSRPQRAGKGRARYTVSDSSDSDDDVEEISDDSDFDEDSDSDE